jgi:DNA-binding transcriptional MerR regulator
VSAGVHGADPPPLPPEPTTAKPIRVRTHLSIGEVLALLQQDYPDITISKIRFLESQGLLNPERTPSGYRKFYESDVEQLRWVLRQQKENFLPLKVIKDRLAAGRLDAPASDSGLLDLNATDGASGTGAAGPRTVAATTTPRSAQTEASSNGSLAASQSAAPQSATSQSATSRSAATGTSRSTHLQPVATGSHTSGDDQQDAGADTGSPPVTAAAAPAPAATATATGKPSQGSVDPSLAGSAQGHDADAGSAQSVESMDLGVAVSSVSMSAREICAASGLTPRQLAELERYGLLTTRTLGHDAVYDEDALVVANLAAAMCSFGLEPRHLRMFKVAAEREAGMYEQMALPRIRTNRPDSRRQALADVARVAGLAEQLHRALLRDALRNGLDPR